MSGKFSGFSTATFDFLETLDANNDKTWFEANRNRYEQDYVAPALEFVEAVSDVAGGLNPPHLAKPKINGSLRRIHRDVRFSKDKTPFNPRLHLVFWCGDHPNRSPAIHLVLHGNGLGYGVGQWAFDAPALEAWRKALGHKTAVAQLKEAMAKARATGCTLTEPALKRPPSGYETVEGVESLLLHKSLVMRTHQPIAAPKALMSNGAVDWFAKMAAQLVPVNRWLVDHLGG